MKNETKNRRYKPAEVAKLLSDCYGHKVTAAVIRKWDNTVLSTIMPEGSRAKGENRAYTPDDVEFFNLIAVLRNIGYSLNYIREVLPTISKIDNNAKIWVFAMDRIAKQRQGLNQVEKLLTRSSNINFGAITAPALEDMGRFPWRPSGADYLEREFTGKFTINGLLDALRKRGFQIPKGKELGFVNWEILWDKDLYKKYPELTFSKEEQKIINFEGIRDTNEIDKLKLFNRSVIDRGEMEFSPKNTKKG